MSEFLFEEFKPVSAKAWKQKIQYDLKGEDYNEKLVWQSPEGIHVKPFYHQDDFSEPFQPVPGQPESWRILQEVFIDDPGKANRIAIHAVERGAERSEERRVGKEGGERCGWARREEKT